MSPQSDAGTTDSGHSTRLVDTELPPQPFVGLRPFDHADSPVFFGRDEQTASILQRLHRTHFLAVIGASGSGKSSLVRAGLIPKLEAGFLVEDRDQRAIVEMNPGTEPIQRLADAIVHADSGESAADQGGRLAAAIRRGGTSAILERLRERDSDGRCNTLLLVDQFEEVFRFGEGLAQRAPSVQTVDLVSLILALAAQRDVPVYVVLTMRADFLGNCDAFALAYRKP